MSSCDRQLLDHCSHTHQIVTPHHLMQVNGQSVLLIAGLGELADEGVHIGDRVMPSGL